VVAQLRFDDQVAIVTGAVSGLGESHALLLASRGAKVVIHDLPEQADAAENLCREINGRGGSAVAVLGRVGDAQDAHRLIEEVLDRFARIDVIVNNAGLGGRVSPKLTEPQNEYSRLQFDVHAHGPRMIVQQAWSTMVAQGYGRVLFTGSAGATGWIGNATGGYETDYAAAKAACFALTRQYAAAGLPHGIRVNMVMPLAFTPLVAATKRGGPHSVMSMRRHLSPALVSAGVAVLVHKDCPVTGEAYSMGGGRMARVFFAATRGYFNPELSPEDALDHWTQAHGVTEDGRLLDAFDMTQPTEAALMYETLETGTIPELDWIARVHPANDRH
jgi:NAD(P)-dependent dehydrogenase (short-subunit alcohol dehydrogenase family)